MRPTLPLLGLLFAVPPAQAAGYGEHGLQRNIPQERAREAHKVEKARGEERIELLRERGHPRHRRPEADDRRGRGEEQRR
jgi:hypothetical protein